MDASSCRKTPINPALHVHGRQRLGCHKLRYLQSVTTARILQPHTAAIFRQGQAEVPAAAMQIPNAEPLTKFRRLLKLPCIPLSRTFQSHARPSQPYTTLNRTAPAASFNNQRTHRTQYPLVIPYYVAARKLANQYPHAACPSGKEQGIPARILLNLCSNFLDSL